MSDFKPYDGQGAFAVDALVASYDLPVVDENWAALCVELAERLEDEGSAQALRDMAQDLRKIAMRAE